jgi:S-(hydroxymethyl)glutathione dehydrogenase / alcohol dehydrogenase
VRSTAGVSSLASQITVDALQVHPVKCLEPAAAALIGCAVSTGSGNVRNVAQVVTGESVAVIGVGGIGINALQTARLLGAKRIIAIDVNPNKAKVAREFGADLFVTTAGNLSATELASQLAADMGGPVDAVIECTGASSVITAALSVLKHGGRLALVGLPHQSLNAEFSIMDMMRRHLTIAGAWNGACNPYVDISDIVQLAEQGRLNLSGQVSHRWPLAQAEEALRALQQGDVIRVVVDFPGEA